MFDYKSLVFEEYIKYMMLAVNHGSPTLRYKTLGSSVMIKDNQLIGVSCDIKTVIDKHNAKYLYVSVPEKYMHTYKVVEGKLKKVGVSDIYGKTDAYITKIQNNRKVRHEGAELLFFTTPFRNVDITGFDKP